MVSDLPADVISVCDVEGNIRPLRFRVRDEEQQMQSIDIQAIVSKKYIHYVGAEAYIFLCETKAKQERKLFELKYHIRNHSWSVIRRIY